MVAEAPTARERKPPLKEVLTPRKLKSLKPAGKRYVFWDATLPHFGVRVTVNGAKSFVVVKRRLGDRDPVTHVIGAYNPDAPPGGEGSLARARAEATNVLAAIAAGRLPAEIEATELREAQRRRHETFGAAVEQFLADGELSGRRSRRETEAILRRQFLGQVSERVRTVTERDGKTVTGWVTKWRDGSESVWRDRPIAEIARRDAIERLDEIKRRGGKHAARHALGAVRRFFNWCAEGERFGVEVSPCASVRDKTIGVSGRDLKRRRVLADDELRDAWAAAGEAGYPFGPLVRLLALTGQRLNDIASARWGEIDLDRATLVVPSERFKTTTAHEVPLAPRAVEIMRALPRFKGAHAFTTTAGARPVSGFSKMKARVDAEIARRREERGADSMVHWTLHDLRRTVRTRLVGDCDVDAFIAERVIGHALPGLHAVYDQGTHRQPKRGALQKWEARLLSIVEPKPGAPHVARADEVERRRA
jgi:integrase